MKKIVIAIVVTIVAIFANNTASAEIAVATNSYENVNKYVTQHIPDASHEEIDKCYNAVLNGPEYTVYRQKIKIECADGEMVVFRRLF